MLIKTLTVGQLSTNCYVVTDETTMDCALIDPGAESGRILNYIEENGMRLRCIMLTHGHFDHTTAVPSVREAYPVPVYINKKDTRTKGSRDTMKWLPPDDISYYSEGDTIKAGSLEFTVMETPGHSEGSVTLRCDNALFTGDTLFRDSCGRTDFEGGNMQVLLGSLKRLSELEGDFEVYPGHAEATSLSRERRFNYYMRYALEG